MKEILKLVKSLKQPLDTEIQHKLTIKYFETRDEDIRMQLLEHNLRLCSTCAIEFCKKYSCPDFAGEAFSLCYCELSNSLEKYNPYNESSCKFGNYAYTNMKLILEKTYTRSNWKESFITDTSFINEEDETDNVFIFLQDTINSNIPDQIANKEMVENIIKLINTFPPKKKKIIKLFLGIDYPRNYSQVEIHDKLNISRQYISFIVNECFDRIKEYIAKNYPDSYPSLAESLSKDSKKKFSSKVERNNYIINSYYGSNNESAKRMKVIESESGLKERAIMKIIKDHKENSPNKPLNPNDRIIFRRVAHYNDERDNIFNDYYGLNGCETHTYNEISNKYKLPLESSYISSLIKCTANKYIKDGIYTDEDIIRLREERKAKLKVKKLTTEYASIYFSFYGIGQYEKKSRIQIAKDLRISPTKVDVAIRSYQKHLDSLGENSSDQISQISQ